jgi:hypothetical protein
MNKWAVRILLLLMLLAFALVFAQLHRQLVMLQRQSQTHTKTTP